MICPGCGGQLGLDCFNQQECMEIAQDMQRAAAFDQREADRNFAFYKENMTHEKVDEIIEAQQERDSAIQFLLVERATLEEKLKKLGYGVPAAVEPKKKRLGRPPGAKTKKTAPTPLEQYKANSIELTKEMA